MKETKLPELADAKSPAGADIRFIMDGETGNMIHSTVPPGQINRATVHETVSEFWYVLEGEGEIWRRDSSDERITSLVPGVSIDIPVGTAFQYRNVGAQPLNRVVRVRHRLDAAGVDGRQLIDQVQYLIDALGDLAHLRSVDADARQGGKFLDLVLCYRHAV